MGLSWEDIKPHLDEVNAKNAQKQAEQRFERAGVAKEMEELLEDPRWQLYTNHLHAIKEPKTVAAKSLSSEILEGALPHDKYVKTLVELARVEGYILGIDHARELIKELIRRGT